jgi:hypothetical protein
LITEVGSPMPTHDTVLWIAPDGVQCVVRPYDESRYQLRLLRQNGTIKTDLFHGYNEALLESDEWRRRLESSETMKGRKD